MRRLHPLTMVVAFLPRLAAAARSLVPVLALSLMQRRDNDYVELIIAAIGVLGGFGAISEYVTTRFGIESGQLIWRTGWIFKRDRQIPLAQVQNVNLKQNVLERFLGVTTLQIETAGGKKSDLKLSVLSNATAEEFRHELIREIAPVAPSEVTIVPERTICELTQRDILIGGLTENHFSSLFVFIASLAGFGGFAASAERFAPMVNRYVGSALPIALMVLAVVAVIVAWIWGTVAYLLKYGDFLVKESGGALRISHGVLTKVQHIVRLDRVEYAQISASFIQRYLGRANLRLGTAGNFGEDGTLAPIALVVPRATAIALMEEITGFADPDAYTWTRYPAWYRWWTSGRGLLISAVLGLIFYKVTQDIPSVRENLPFALLSGIMIFIGIVLLASLASFLSLVRAGFAETDQVIAVRTGFFSESIEFMPWERIEFARIDQKFFWRRRGAVTCFVQGMVRHIYVRVLSAESVDRVLARLNSHSALRQEAKRLKNVPTVVEITA